MKSLELPEFVAKFDPNEPRDDRGKWTTGGLGVLEGVAEVHPPQPRLPRQA
jgi:hypothetical protein